MAEISAIEKELMEKLKACDARQKALFRQELELKQREAQVERRHEEQELREKAIDAKETESMSNMKNRIKTLEKEKHEEALKVVKLEEELAKTVADRQAKLDILKQLQSGPTAAVDKKQT